jgi:CBS domain containing-hemolysin-like protein
MQNVIDLLIAFVLVALNGFFVAVEFALVKVRSTRLAELANEGKPMARMALHAIHHMDVYLSACQVGISLASIALGRVGEPVVARLLEPALHALHVPEQALHPIAFTVALSLVTAVHIVVGEQAPKYWAIQRAENASMALSYPLHWFYWLFKPAIRALNAATMLILRLFRITPSSEHDLAHSEEELRMIVTASGQSGVLKDSEVDLVKHVFEFADKVASDIMVPRVDMVYMDASWPLARNLEIVRNHTYTRYPLCEGDPDHVLGMIHIKDLVKLGPGADLREIRRDMMFVPETKSIDQLLREFQMRKVHMATVVDEYGGTAGIVTMEDVLEQIVGEIHDEHEEPLPEVQPLGDDRFLVDGKVLLTDLKADYEIEIPPNGSETVGGWVLDKIGGIPEAGAAVETSGYLLEVQEIEGQRVRKVVIIRTRPHEGAEEAEAPGVAGGAR